MYRLYCSKCNEEIDPLEPVWRCHCKGILDIEVNLDKIKVNKRTFEKRVYSMWRYLELLPIVDKSYIVTLGEGWTPLITDKKNKRVYLKLDYLNPTGSFKDRGASVLISHVKYIGINNVVEDSSGNAGASIAAYSSLAGIKAKIFVPKDAPRGKVLQIRSYGAEVIEVPGDREDVNREALKSCVNALYVGHLWNPFFIEGIKTMAFEYSEQRAWSAPDSVIVPVGSGGLLIGLYRGFRDLYLLGFIDNTPRMYGVQAVGCSPIYDLFHGKQRKITSPILADGIAVPNPPRKFQVIEIVSKTKGNIVLVDNDEIIRAWRELCKIGLLVEPTSATSYAAYRKLVEEGTLDPSEDILIPLTGTGLKTLDKLNNIIKDLKNLKRS